MSKIIEVISFGDEPWTDEVPNVRIGYLNGTLNLTTESGIAAGMDLDDVTQPHIAITEDTFSIHLGETGKITMGPSAESYIRSGPASGIHFYLQNQIRYTFFPDGILLYDNAGDPSKIINTTHNTWQEAPDMFSINSMGLGANDYFHVFIDGDNQSTNAYFSINKNGISYDSSENIFRVTEDNKVLLLDESGVAHGATSIFPTEVFGGFKLDESGAGGLAVYGMKDGDQSDPNALKLYGLMADDADTGFNPNRDVNSRGLVEVYAGQLSGTGLADVVSNGLVWVIRARRGSAWETVWMIDEDGDILRDGGTNTFDEEDDTEAISDLYHVLCGDSQNVVRYDRARLVQMGIIGSNTGRPYISDRMKDGLVFGAIRQTRQRQNMLISAANIAKDRLIDLESRVLALEGS